jgi:DNA-directed RNA polymerase subunit H (RpoH/RPB5)
MRTGDPAAVALKAKPGDMIRCERNDGTGKYTAYRIVVED